MADGEFGALYLHLPFCPRRCAYCSFPSCAIRSDDPLVDAYVDALTRSVHRAARSGVLSHVSSAYLGGGTPSFLGGKRLASLIYLLDVMVPREEGRFELTVECNPDSVDERLARDLFALGVTRFSLGVQSFDDARLGALGRVHDAAQARRAIDILQDRGAACSVDLICGGLGQTREQWHRDLEAVVASGVGHVSVYPLTVDEGTPLSERVAANTVDAPDDEQADMMLDARDVLEGSGLMRYEVASYARLGQESRHNSAYWTGVPYLGLGPGAASMMPVDLYRGVEELGLWRPGDAAPAEGMSDCARVRISPRTTRMHEAIVSYAEEGLVDVEVELLDARAAACEDLMLGMRLVRGVEGRVVATARETVPGLDEVFASLVRDGLATVTSDGGYQPTDRGWLLGNELYGRLWGLSR